MGVDLVTAVAALVGVLLGALNFLPRARRLSRLTAQSHLVAAAPVGAGRDALTAYVDQALVEYVAGLNRSRRPWLQLLLLLCMSLSAVGVLLAGVVFFASFADPAPGWRGELQAVSLVLMFGGTGLQVVVMWLIQRRERASRPICASADPGEGETATE